VLCQAGRVSSAPALLWRRLTAEFLGSAFLAAVVSFIGAQVVGGALAVGVIKALYPDVTPAEAADVIVPHDQTRARPASTRAARDGTSPFADRPSGPAQSH